MTTEAVPSTRSRGWLSGPSLGKEGAPEDTPRTKAPQPFRALAHPNFRLYLAGQGVSIIGSWMQNVAMAWLVYLLTGSAVWLGVVACAGQIPALFLTPLAGGLIDRCARHRLLLLTQSVAMTQACVLAFLTLTGLVEPWHLIALSFLL